MTEKKKPKHALVPEWLLSKFRKPYLYELDIFTAN